MQKKQNLICFVGICSVKYKIFNLRYVSGGEKKKNFKNYKQHSFSSKKNPVL